MIHDWMKQKRNYLKKRDIQVEFRNVGANIVDATHFDPKAYSAIRASGLRISPLNIVHAASIHYQDRYPESFSKRKDSAYREIERAITSDGSDGLIVVSDGGSEKERSSTEVIAVGIMALLARNLFDIKYADLKQIQTSGKRCDYEFVKLGMRYLLESKGRKNNINSAIIDIFKKKDAYAVSFPKYGIISHIPRNIDCTKVIVVDPEGEEQAMSTDYIMAGRMMYYSRILRLCRIFRLANAVQTKAMQIYQGRSYRDAKQERLFRHSCGIVLCQSYIITSDSYRVSRDGIVWQFYSSQSS
jgi:hypothetical protein